MFDDLEQLLKTAKREAHQRKERQVRDRHSTPKHVPLKQAEMEWEVGQTVCLIHRAEDGTETALGLFTEYLRNGSRWLRPSADTLSPDHTEIVTGSWWLHPSIREVPVDTPHEIAAIRARFEMLIKEFAEDFLDNNPQAHLALPDPDDEDEDLEIDEDDEDEDEDDDWEDDDEDEE